MKRMLLALVATLALASYGASALAADPPKAPEGSAPATGKKEEKKDDKKPEPAPAPGTTPPK